MELNIFDLKWAIHRCPKVLKELMQKPEWEGRIFVGGGYLRSIVSGEKINDVDVFAKSKEEANQIAVLLNDGSKYKIFETDNAFTVRGKMSIQVIHRWVFDSAEDVSDSFDFTICCAAINFVDGKFRSFCDDQFYVDLAAKRLVYRRPVRNEDAGGSMLRILKYYQRGYRIPLDSLGAVISRLMQGVDYTQIENNELEVAKIITALLVEVDPAIDPDHLAHLPAEDTNFGVDINEVVDESKGE